MASNTIEKEFGIERMEGKREKEVLQVSEESEEYENLVEITMDTDDIYQKLVKCIFDELDEEVKNAEDIKKLPKLDIIYTKQKTMWTNFRKVCDSIKRDERDIIRFIKNEYKREPSVNDGGTMLIKGKYLSMLPNTFKKYASIFVICKSCGSFETEVVRNHRLGVDYLVCTSKGCETPIVKKK